ncbi:MAG: hypothetical protein PHG16_11785 [Lachnospiraceae bacterium]|nr:hypothetical protein [Lachnospiraceae bacterium]
MTKQEELGSSLQTLLSFLKKNREHVGRELLHTHYRKPYYELLARVNQTATAYVKAVALSGLLINPDVSIDKQCMAINQAIENSGLLKEMGRSISRTYDVTILHQLALQLRALLIDVLEPYINLKTCLVADLSDMEREPIIYNTLSKCIYKNSEWIYHELDLYGKLLIFIKPENTIAGNAPAESEIA